MTVVFVAPGAEKVATWRTIWPAQELKRRGYQVAVYGAAQYPPPAKEPTGDCTYVVHMINKAWQVAETGRILTMLDVMRWAREFGRVVLSVDDDWTKMLHIQQGGPDALSREVHARIPEMVRQADSVIVATPRLAEVYGKWAREVHLVENALPEWVLQMEQVPRYDRIAWMGEMYVHGGDWNMLQPYAHDLPPLYLVGCGRESARRIRSWGADVMYTEAIFDQRKLYREMGRAVGAIIPLEDTPFNRGKSWSKPLEFMARQVQPVASAHAEYGRLNDLTGALPTYEEPHDLVQAATEAWEARKGHPDEDLPDRLRSAGLTMETGGGDAWEKALA